LLEIERTLLNLSYNYLLQIIMVKILIALQIFII